MPIGDVLDTEDFDTFVEIMRCGRHATIAGCIRSALWNYGHHFAQQGLMKLPANAFALDRRRH